MSRACTTVVAGRAGFGIYPEGKLGGLTVLQGGEEVAGVVQVSRLAPSQDLPLEVTGTQGELKREQLGTPGGLSG